MQGRKHKGYGIRSGDVGEGCRHRLRRITRGTGIGKVGRGRGGPRVWYGPV